VNQSEATLENYSGTVGHCQKGADPSVLVLSCWHCRWDCYRYHSLLWV